MGISGKSKNPDTSSKKKITKKTYKKDEVNSVKDSEIKSSLHETVNNKDRVTTGSAIKVKNENEKEDLNKIMDPTPEEVIKAIQKGEDGEACYRLSLCRTSTVGSLKEFLSYIPDDTLVRIGGQTNGFVQMDTTYPDLNFCVPEECGCCDEGSSTTTLHEAIISYADFITDVIAKNNACEDNFNVACRILDLNPDAMLSLLESFAESTTQTEVEISLYKKALMVIGLMQAFGVYEGTTFERCPEGCPKNYPEFLDAFKEAFDEEYGLMKSLCKIARISMSADIHITPRRKKNKKGYKKITETDKENILKTIIPSDASEFGVTMPKHGCYMRITYRTDDTNPFGKVPTFCGIPFDQIHVPECAEECIACDGCNPDEGSADDPCECTETKIADAQCVQDDDANDDD